MRSEKTNYTFKYFMYQLGQLKGIIIFAAIFSMLFFPCLFIVNGATTIDIEASCLILAIISFIGLIAVSFIAPLKAMKHLYTKTTADNILSLPLTSTQRFIADICAGFGAFAVPFAVSIPVSFVVRSIFHAAMDFKIVFLAFFLLLMFAAFNTLLITCCGRKIEAILYPIALNMAVPLFTILGTFISYYNSYGISYSAGLGQALNGFLGYFVGVTSPIGALFLAVIKRTQIPIIVSAVMTIVFLAISFVLYKKRPAQRIGQPFVFKPVFIITTVFISISAIIAYVAILLNFTVDTEFELGSNIIAILVIVFILMLVMEFVNSKRIKSIPKFLIKYAATTVGGLLLCLVLYSSEGFGIVSYIPADDAIDYIHINQYGKTYNSDNYATIAGGSDAAKMITELHKNRLENRDYDCDEYYDSISISYFLKNGQTVERSYPKADYSFWSELYSSEGYRLDKINTLELSDSEHLYYQEAYIYTSDDSECLVKLVNKHNENICYYHESGKTIPEKLISALKADLSEDTEYGRHSDAAIGQLELFSHFYSTYVPIYESYVYTLAYLNSMGAQVPTAEQTAQDGADSSLYYSIVRMPYTDDTISSAEMILISEEEYKSLLSREVLHNTSSDNEYEYYLVLGISDLFIGSPEYYTTGSYDREAQLKKFGEAGVKSPETTFGSMLYSTAVNIDYNFHYNLINEEMHGELSEMFNERVVIESLY